MYCLKNSGAIEYHVLTNIETSSSRKKNPIYHLCLESILYEYTMNRQ